MVLRLQSAVARERMSAPLPSVLDVMRLRGFMHASSVSARGAATLRWPPALHKRNACMGKNPCGFESETKRGLGPR